MKTIFFLIIVLGFSCSTKERTDVVWLVPEGYIGAIGVYYDYEEEGAEIEYENKKRVYRIPESGILKTKFSSNVWIENDNVFYLDEFGNRSEIPFKLKQPFFSQKNRQRNVNIIAVGIHGRGSSKVTNLEKGIVCITHKSDQLYINVESNMDQYNTPVYRIKSRPIECDTIK